MTAALDIIATGMVTAVGLDAPSSCAALRARLDGFKETPYADGEGEWLLGAPVSMPRRWIGQKRMIHMAAAAISEICTAVPEARERTPMLLCLPEASRPSSSVQDVSVFLRNVCAALEMDVDPRSRIVSHGRPSGLVALEQARRLLAEGGTSAVIVAGVDSYLTPEAIGFYLANRRLLATNNPNGFIPGEAAAAVLCTHTGHGSALRLHGLGLARENAFIYNEADEPLRGDGMTTAYRHALNEAGIEMNQLGFRISDLIGEQYWFKQTALASLRLVRGAHDFQDLWSPGESLGNIGAAAVPVMIGMALAAARKGYAAGNPVLIEASDDSGACGAAIFAARAA
ncbi:MAG: 3-oxoacyl-ACP synthase [Mesorhizobium sp.]|nr:MAG: 3-oxoacyl-ACP synthase [Mesorhizobium sp.]